MGALLCLLMVLQAQFPRPGSGVDERRGVDQSFITGQVKSKGGEPVGLATVSVHSRGDASRADQRGNGSDWPGAETRVRKDGSFRISVPGGTTFEVCANLPGKTQQCRLVEVSRSDMEVVLFEF